MSLISFIYGFSAAVIAVMALAIYAFSKAKEYTAVKLRDTIASIQHDKAAVEAAAKLDPIRLTSHVRLCMGTTTMIPDEDGDAGIPGSSSSAAAQDQDLHWSPKWTNCRLVLLGTTITVYETLASSDVTSSNSGSSASANNSGSSSAAVTAERYIGKISTPLINHRVLPLEEVMFQFADPMSLAAAAVSPSSSSAAPASASAGGGLRSPADRDRMGAYISASTILTAATTLHRAVGGGVGSITEKNAEDWLREHIQGKVLFLELNTSRDDGDGAAGGAGGGSHSRSQPSSSSSGSGGSIFLQPTSRSGAADPSSSSPSTTSSRSPPHNNVSCLLLLFNTKRDQDRWANVLAATERTYEWKQYVRTLPSLDVLNLLAARIFFENTSGPAFADFVRRKIERKLRAVVLPKPLTGHIEVVRVTPGAEVPLIHNVSFASFSTNGEIAFDFDLHYRGGFQVVFAASFVVKSISVPQLLFYVRILEVGGKVHVSIGPPPTNKFWIGFHTPPSVRLEFSQEVASHEGVLSSILSWIPDLSDVITNLVKVELFADMLLPNQEDYELPNIGEKADDDEEDGGVEDNKNNIKTGLHPNRPQQQHQVVLQSKPLSAPSTVTSSTSSQRLIAEGLHQRRHSRAASDSTYGDGIGGSGRSPNTTASKGLNTAAVRGVVVSPPPPRMHSEDDYVVLTTGAMKTPNMPRPSGVAASEDPLSIGLRAPAAPTPRSSDDVVNSRHTTPTSRGSGQTMPSPSEASRGSGRRGSDDVPLMMGGGNAMTTTTSTTNVKKQVDDLRSALLQKAADVKKATPNATSSSSSSLHAQPTSAVQQTSSHFHQPQWSNPSF